MPIDSQTAVNINGATFNVWDEGVTETWAQYKSTTQKATWNVRTLWNDRIPFMNAILGGSTNLGGTTIFINGWQYPYNAQWFAQNIQVKGDGFKIPGPGGICAYQRADMTVSFGVPDFQFGNPLDIGDDELDFSCETLNFPSDTSVLAYADGKPVPGGQVRSIDVGIIGYNRVRYNMANLPINTVRACINAVNSAPIFGGAAGTVKFVGGKSRRKITAAGPANWDVTFSFTENIQGWNNLYEAGVGLTPVHFIGGTDPLFRLEDLNKLFLANAN